MSKPKILEETPIGLSELKSELAKIKKRDGELSYRANKTEEYLNMFVEDTQKRNKELYEAVEKLKIPRLKEQHILKLVDIKPSTLDDVKLVLHGFTITVTQDNLKKIAKVFA